MALSPDESANLRVSSEKPAVFPDKPAKFSEFVRGEGHFPGQENYFREGSDSGSRDLSTGHYEQHAFYGVCGTSSGATRRFTDPLLCLGASICSPGNIEQSNRLE